MRNLLNGLAAANAMALLVAVRKRTALREYLSKVSKLYRDTAGLGLLQKSPILYLQNSGMVPFSADTRVQLPAILYGDGGTTTEELTFLAAVTRVLQPRVVFEIGTFTGLTTSLFILNAPEGARIISMDLPPDEDVQHKGYIGHDADLVKERNLGRYTRALGLENRYEQWLGDSMELDPEPLANQVDLGFIDGAHALPWVVNDTEKMGRMITDNGMVLWHDYGGIGEFRPLAEYLEQLSAHAPFYRIPLTTTAWCLGRDLKTALAAVKRRV